MIIPFPTGSNVAENPVASQERLYNMYAEVEQKLATTVLYRASGTVRVAGTPLGNIECRGAFGWQDVGYIVIGDKLYQFTPSGLGYDIQERGTLNTSTGRVTFAADLDEIGIADGSFGYVYNTDSGVFTQINDPDFRAGTHISHLNGFMITSSPTSNVWQISSPQQALDYDALDIAVAEANGDNIQAHAVHEERVWLLGTHTYEVWVPTTSDFPFDRQTVQPVGCAARYSVATADNSLFWLDWHGMVRRTQGLRTVIVSNQALNNAVAKMANYQDAFAFTFTERGHIHYQITFPSANQTWVHDLLTGEWWERGYRDPINGTDGRHHANCLMFTGGQNLVGDYRDGRVYNMTPLANTDDQEEQTWECITPVVYDGEDPSRPVRFYDLSLISQTGTGTSQTRNPKVRMAYTDDGGFTWSDDLSRTFDVGVGIEGYRQSVKWRRLGRSKFKGRSFRFRGDDNVVTSLINASARVI